MEIKRLVRPVLSPSGKIQTSNVLGFASLNGHVGLLDSDSVCCCGACHFYACQVLWQKKLNQQLFGVSGIDITGNGYENLVFSSWDGSTYIFDQDNNCLQFQFEDQVCGFIAGRLTSLRTSVVS